MLCFWFLLTVGFLGFLVLGGVCAFFNDDALWKLQI